MDIAISVGLLILSLSILVTIHELGHFWAARSFGIKVEKFYLFFDPWFSLFKKKIGDTEYGIGWLPLGGYVKISGMIDESVDTEQMSGPAQPWEFRAKPAWQRLIVMLGGIIMNVILGCVIFISLKFINGDTVIPMEKLEEGIWVRPGTGGEVLGLKSGDMIVTFTGEPVKYFSQVENPSIFLDEDAYLELKRDGQDIKIDIPNDFLRTFQELPADKQEILRINGANEIYYDTTNANSPPAKAGLKWGDIITSIDSTPAKTRADLTEYLATQAPETAHLVTVQRGGNSMDFTIVTDTAGKLQVGFINSKYYDKIKYSFVQSIGVGTSFAFKQVILNAKGLAKIFTGKADAGKSMSGPIKIGAIMGDSFKKGGWTAFWSLTGLLSMVLALMNLLPIPALDGGHVVFLLYEIVTGREPNDKVKIVAQYIGMAILLLLMVFIFFNDIRSLLIG